MEPLTEQESDRILKSVCQLAISAVTYRRSIFPQNAFATLSFGDLKMKILVENDSHRGAQLMVNFLNGCYDALDKKYLRELQIGISTDPDDPQTVMEFYALQFSYSSQYGGLNINRKGMNISRVHDPVEYQGDTIQLLMAINALTDGLPPLPENIHVTLKVFLYDEVTPAEYEVPGYHPHNFNNFLFQDYPIDIKLGKVTTPFHSVKMKVITSNEQLVIEAETEDMTSKDSEQNLSLEVPCKWKRALSLVVKENAEINRNMASGLQLHLEKEGFLVVANKAVRQNKLAASSSTWASSMPPKKMEGCKIKENDPPEQELEDPEELIDKDIATVADSTAKPEVGRMAENDDNSSKEEEVDIPRNPTYMKVWNSVVVQATSLWRTLSSVVDLARFLPNKLTRQEGGSRTDQGHLEKQDSETLEKQDSDTLEKQDSDTLEKQDSDTLEKRDSDTLEKRDSDTLEKRDSDMEKQDYGTLEEQDSDMLEEQDSDMWISDDNDSEEREEEIHLFDYMDIGTCLSQPEETEDCNTESGPAQDVQEKAADTAMPKEKTKIWEDEFNTAEELNFFTTTSEQMSEFQLAMSMMAEINSATDSTSNEIKNQKRGLKRPFINLDQPMDDDVDSSPERTTRRFTRCKKEKGEDVVQNEAETMQETDISRGLASSIITRSDNDMQSRVELEDIRSKPQNPTTQSTQGKEDHS